MQLLLPDKKIIYDLMAEDYINALKKRQIKNSQRKHISSYILQSIKSFSTWEDLNNFLNKFFQENKFVNNSYLKLKQLYYRKKEKSIMKRLRKQIKDFKLI